MIHFHKWEKIYPDFTTDHYKEFRKCLKCNKKQVLTEQWSTTGRLCGYLGDYLWEELTLELEIKILSAIETMIELGQNSGKIPYDLIDIYPLDFKLDSSLERRRNMVLNNRKIISSLFTIF